MKPIEQEMKASLVNDLWEELWNKRKEAKKKINNNNKTKQKYETLFFSFDA